MLDIKFIRENAERVKEAVKNKHKDVDVDKLLTLDDQRRVLQRELDDARAEQNRESEAIVKAGPGEKQKLIAEMAILKEKIKQLEADLGPITEECDTLLFAIPNVMDPSVPVGADENDNVVVKEWGTKPTFTFKPREHWELGEMLGIIDTDKAAEIAGARFWYLKGDLVRLQFALHQFAFDTLTDENVIAQVAKEAGLEGKVSTKPFVPMLPPVMIRTDVHKAIHRVYGDTTYALDQDALDLVASAEHTLAPYHMNETLDESELPKRYIGFSTAFRREAGSYGKDMKGILRGHQFDKSEMESFTTAEQGPLEQKLIVALQEYLVQQLGLPYQLLQICSGDMGGPDYNQIDINCWLPGQDQYRETNTSDYMTDYQMRGIKSYYKTKDGERKLLHTNDATAFSGRPLIAIMENYQQEDGSIVIPPVLRPYMKGQTLITRS